MPETMEHRIVLTGATGGLGHAILTELTMRHGCAALALVRNQTWLAPLAPQVRCEPVNFADVKHLTRLVEAFQPTAFIHCAATGMQTPRPTWQEMLECNVALSVQLCEVAALVPHCQFVFVSSGLAYRNQGRPLCEDDPLDTRHPYAASKAAAETLVRAVAADCDLPLAFVRPFSFSGPGDTGTRLFPSLLRAAEQKLPLDISPGDQVRDHCAVRDIARGVLAVAVRKAACSAEPEIFNLGGGNPDTLQQLIEGVVAELDLKVKLNFGGRAPIPFEPKFLVADISRAQNQLGWRPQINFAHAVWELAQESFPALKLRQPAQYLLTHPTKILN